MSQVNTIENVSGNSSVSCANNVTVLAVADKFNADQVRVYVEAEKEVEKALDNVRSNFQGFITEAIEANKVDCLLDYAHEKLAELGKGKEMNSLLTNKLRKPLERACKKLDIPKMTIKWNNDLDRYVFVEATAQTKPDTEDNTEETTDTPDSVHSEASRLMAEFLNNRTVDNASKVTRFMMDLID